MGNSRTEVLQTIEDFLVRAKKSAPDGLSEDTRLFADGLGLDSLATAELSATLEDEHEHDPFTAGTMPQTIGELLSYYDGLEPAV